MIDWTHWHNEPLLIGAMVVASWLYALAVGPWRGHLAAGEPFPRGAVLRFAAGMIIFYLAVGSPLDQIGERFLFSAHMAQHLILVYVVAALLLTGTPAWLVDFVLDRPFVRPVARLVTRPLPAAVIYVLTLSLWHIPAAYDHALRDKFVHVVQHLSFLAVALLMWWPLIGRSRVAPRSAPGVQILYVFGLGILQFPLVAFLNFSREPLYLTYQYAPRITSLSPREDQVTGGAFMGVGGMFIALGLISWSFHTWFRRSERPSENEPS